MPFLLGSRGNAVERLTNVIVPDVASTLDFIPAEHSAPALPDGRSGTPRLADPRLGTGQRLWRLAGQQPAQRHEDIMFGWAIAFLIIALIAARFASASSLEPRSPRRRSYLSWP